MSSQEFRVLLKDVLAVLKVKCDVPVIRLPTASPSCQFILLLNFTAIYSTSYTGSNIHSSQPEIVSYFVLLVYIGASPWSRCFLKQLNLNKRQSVNRDQENWGVFLWISFSHSPKTNRLAELETLNCNCVCLTIYRLASYPGWGWVGGCMDGWMDGWKNLESYWKQLTFPDQYGIFHIIY